VITVYAVAAGVRRAPQWAGVDGSPVELVSHRSLAAAISRHGAAPVASRDAILAHAGVCDELLNVAEAVLPVRFGAAYTHDVGLHASLDERHDSLVAELDHVWGRVEVGVRVRWDDVDDSSPAAGSPPDTGRSYLMGRVDEERRRRAREERAEAIAAELHRTLALAAADSRVQVLVTAGLLLSGAYLVDRDGIDRMVMAARAAATEHPQFDLLCTGPWPPYHFAAPEVARA
jgi:hypothetical protein